MQIGIVDSAQGVSAVLSSPELAERDAGAGRRLAARIFDMGWQVPLVAFGLVFVLGSRQPDFLTWVMTPGNGRVLAFLSCPIAVIIDAILLARFGTSPGKALLGLRLVTFDGGRPGYRVAIARNLRMWMLGMACCIPLLSLIAMVRQARRIRGGQGANYDAGRFRVQGRQIGWLRALGFCCATLLCAVLVLFAAARASTMRVPEPLGSVSSWTNPETGKAVTVPSNWEHHDLTSLDGEHFHEFRLLDGRASVLFWIQLAGDLPLDDMADETHQFLQDVEMGSGRIENYLGSPSWAGEGFSDDRHVERYEARVMQYQGRYWSVIVAQAYPYRDSDAQVEALRAILWSTVKGQPPQ